MKIKLNKPAEWQGKKHKSASVCDVPDRIGKKLIDRGYSEIYVEEQKAPEDAPTSGE